MTSPPFLVVCDPAWNADAGGGGRGAGEHYALSGVDAIAAAMRTSSAWRDEGPGLLWMWATTSAFIAGDAHALARLLGFRPCAGFVWCKVDTTEAEGAFRAPRRMGLGQWSRVEHEHLVLCRRGNVRVPPPAARSRSVIYAPRGEHSEKPAAAWSVIEWTSRAVLGFDVRGVEFNARVVRPGWVAVGRLEGEDGPVVVRGAP